MLRVGFVLHFASQLGCVTHHLCSAEFSWICGTAGVVSLVFLRKILDLISTEKNEVGVSQPCFCPGMFCR